MDDLTSVCSSSKLGGEGSGPFWRAALRAIRLMSFVGVRGFGLADQRSTPTGARSPRMGGRRMRPAFVVAASLLGLSMASNAAAAGVDWRQVDAAIGKSAAMTGNVHRYALPRTDLKVRLDGVDLKPGFALGGWVAFEDMGSSAMMMGDLVLTETEINPVMTKLLADGIDVTALHNHLIRAEPPTFFLHVSATGDPIKLARMVRQALSTASQTPFGPPAAPSAAPSKIDLDTSAIDRIIGFKGKNNGGVYAFSVPRSDQIKMGNMPIPSAMGTAIGINFQPTGGGKAAITGDFVARADEVEPLLKALRSHGIDVTALHNHMIDERPRAFFIHFWANDDAVKLARGLRSALDAVHVAKKA